MDVDFLQFQQLVASRNGNENVFARFYDRAEKTAELNELGLPIFKTRCFVEIKCKDNHDIYDQPASNEHFKRFPVEYARYKLEKQQKISGTPLEQFAFLTVDQLELCHHYGVFTVEQLSGLEDERAKSLQLLKEKELADKFLSVSKNNKVIDDFAKKEREYKAKIKKLEKEIEELKK